MNRLQFLGTALTITVQFLFNNAHQMEGNIIRVAFFLAWVFVSIFIYRKFKTLIKRDAIDKARFVVGYIVSSILLILYTIGKILIPDEYYANLVSEAWGMAITILIIERANNYLNNKDEQLYRNFAFRRCKMPIFSYCYQWFALYEPDKNVRQTKLARYASLEDFFMSDDFYNTICGINFMQLMSVKTKADYYGGSIEKIEENFQSILVKYASKLSPEDIKLLEFFGGGAYMYNVFRWMKFASSLHISTQVNGSTPQTGSVRHLNDFGKVSKDNFQKHFRKLLSLIEGYNSVSIPGEEWNLTTLNNLTTFSNANADTYDW